MIIVLMIKDQEELHKLFFNFFYFPTNFQQIFRFFDIIYVVDWRDAFMIEINNLCAKIKDTDKEFH